MAFGSKLVKLMRQPRAFVMDAHGWPLNVIGHALRSRERSCFIQKSQGKNAPKVSVIMTVYNTAPYVEKAIQSVLAQNYTNFELLIINDASTDDSLSAIKNIAALDHRIQVFSSSKNHGTYWSKNWCMSKAKGDFITFHDSDDISDPDRLSVEVGAMLTHPDKQACSCRWHRVDENDEPVSIDGRYERMAVITTMIRRSVLDDIGYFDCVRIAADSEYVGRIKSYYGERAFLSLVHVLYSGLIRQDALTRGEGSGIEYVSESGADRRKLVGDRATYHEAFEAWHASLSAADKAA